MHRRTFLRTTLAAASPAFVTRAADLTASAVDKAHSEIWRRFIDKYGIMIDFTDLDGSVSLPTPEECKLGKPNALGWWAPIENGAMFNGLYMDAAVNRWRHTKADADAAKARRLMEGLLLLNSISDVKGFVGRGVSTNGKSHYPMGSNDQTLPWFLGLWRYLDSGLATEDERKRIVASLVTTADVIVSLKWQMPAEQPFGVRGGFGGYTFESSPRLLFLCKMMHAVTSAPKWDGFYRDALNAQDHKRLQACEQGLHFAPGHNHTWTGSCGVAALRVLWELEKDETLRATYARGLQASATVAMQSLPDAYLFDNNDTSHFEHDWRVMNKHWKPQQTEQEAQDLAHVQLKEFIKLSPRRSKETAFVREPTFAAWIITLAPDATILKQRADEVKRVLAHYDYERLIYSQFFAVESAWWRLQDAL